MSENKEGLDLLGWGKIAEAIPPAVYEQTTATVVKTFENLVAPITETTSGLGRYLRQKFDNMVEVEKAVATYTIENAMNRARRVANDKGDTASPSTAHQKLC